MVERSERFEIASRRDGRWAIEAVRIRMDESVALARELLARGAYEAVRVVRARDIADRTVFESVVFEAERDGDGEPPIRLAAERMQLKLVGKLPPADAEMLTRSSKTIVDQVGVLNMMVDEFSDYARLPAAKLAPLQVPNCSVSVPVPTAVVLAA